MEENKLISEVGRVIILKQSSKEIMNKLLDTEYIDAKLKELSYEHTSHTVVLKYGDPAGNKKDYQVIFKDCFSASFNTWLEGMSGTVPEKPDNNFFLHNIEIEDIEVNGIQLYKCSLTIPMMDCQVTCVSIEINYPN
ncbi:hypothetical protein D3H55_13145 [Bacillus salacetis]|uniref:Uncharacterized protein n=1 Tax=Bacillus salacetis TaxID=2315464 RepID=A0A3A1QVT2_9BACI|nr:hypothetical protein [Bacillus salacetis]RIW32527.1 hypothetical protein D3H55_13145 [Bacillus salacetis]